MLEVRNASKRFGGLQAVNNASFTVPKGQVTGLVGPNGAGKTTLFNIISGTIPPDEGQVLLEGKDITQIIPQQRIGHGLARTFQDVRTLVRLSVLENVLIGIQQHPGERLRNVLLRPRSVTKTESEGRDRAMQALEFVGLDKVALDEPAGNLSYGEQKLLAIARILVTEAKFLMLDEPTSGLDEASLDTFRAVLSRLMEEGHTVLIVEHNMLLVRELCDRAVFLNFGEVLAVDTPERLMEMEELRDVYFGA